MTDTQVKTEYEKGVHYIYLEVGGQGDVPIMHIDASGITLYDRNSFDRFGVSIISDIHGDHWQGIPFRLDGTSLDSDNLVDGRRTLLGSMAAQRVGV